MLSFLLKLISYIPFKVLYLISDSLFYPLYYVARYRRNVTRKNLSECFPDKTDRELNDIEKGFYRFFVDNILETCGIPRPKGDTVYTAEEAKAVAHSARDSPRHSARCLM